MSANTSKTFQNVLASQTDTILVAGIPNFVIKVISVAFQPGATATSVTFNSKGTTSGTAISATFTPAANGFDDLPWADDGWFSTILGQSLSVTTGSGATVGIEVIYTLDNSA